jgi:hypothetical protein
LSDFQGIVYSSCRIIRDRYNLGDLKVDVLFRFDHNDKFYFFRFRTEAVSANHLETKVYEEGDYLTNVFKAKYGKPSKCYKHPKILGIKQGKVAPLCLWEHSDLKIYTGITKSDKEYFAVGNVISKSMEEKYVKSKKQKESKGAAKGAKSF